MTDLPSPLLTLTAHGTPAPQGSKKFVGVSTAGHGILVESSKKVAPWRDAVRADAVNAVQALGDLWPGVLDEPLLVEMVFTFVRPPSHYRTGRNAHLLRDGAPRRPSGPPDLSKLVRSTEDALTDAGIWKNDARVVEFSRIAKVYIGEDPGSLDCPGARIVIRRIDGN